MAHTPGPWKADERSGCVAVYPAGERHTCLSGASTWAIHFFMGRSIIDQDGLSTWDLPEEAIANARLIAAAPELLAACEAARDWLDRYGANSPTQFGGEFTLDGILRAAIAKAKGA